MRRFSALFFGGGADFSKALGKLFPGGPAPSAAAGAAGGGLESASGATSNFLGARLESHFPSVVYFSRGALPPKKVGKSWHYCGDLESFLGGITGLGRASTNL